MEINKVNLDWFFCRAGGNVICFMEERPFGNMVVQ